NCRVIGLLKPKSICYGRQILHHLHERPRNRMSSPMNLPQVLSLCRSTWLGSRSSLGLVYIIGHCDIAAALGGFEIPTFWNSTASLEKVYVRNSGSSRHS